MPVLAVDVYSSFYPNRLKDPISAISMASPVNATPGVKLILPHSRRSVMYALT